MSEKSMKWVLIGLVGAAVAAMALIWQDLGVGPKGVPKIKPFRVEAPEIIGEHTYLRLREEIAREPVLFLGLDGEDPRQVQALRGFIAAAEKDGRPFARTACQKGLLPATAGIDCEPMELAQPTDSIRQWLPQYKGSVALLVVPMSYASHLITGGPMYQMEELWKRAFMAISWVQMATQPDQMARLRPPCLGTERDRDGGGDLACVIRRLSRAVHKKKFSKQDLVYQLVMQGEKDYLGLISLPPRE